MSSAEISSGQKLNEVIQHKMWYSYGCFCMCSSLIKPSVALIATLVVVAGEKIKKFFAKRYESSNF